MTRSGVSRIAASAARAYRTSVDVAPVIAASGRATIIAASAAVAVKCKRVTRAGVYIEDMNT